MTESNRPDRTNGGDQLSNGKFAPGNQAAKGAKNPLARLAIERTHAFRSAITTAEIAALAAKLYGEAMGGDIAAARLVLEWCCANADIAETAPGNEAAEVLARVVLDQINAARFTTPLREM